jgi:hypothetical protein
MLLKWNYKVWVTLVSIIKRNLEAVKTERVVEFTEKYASNWKSHSPLKKPIPDTAVPTRMMKISVETHRTVTQDSYTSPGLRREKPMTMSN